MTRRRYVASLFACVLGALASSVSCATTDCADDATCAPLATAESDADVVEAEAAAVEAAPPPAKNPYGVDYPTSNLGWRVRQGSTPGDVIPDVVFERGIPARAGAEPAAVSVRSVRLADLFDPETRTHDVIVLVLAEAGDPSTRTFFDDNLLGAAPTRTAVLSALGYGYTLDVEPSNEHFTQWADEHPWSWHVMDKGFAQLDELGGLDELGRLVGLPPAPVIVLIDARSMELAFFHGGAMPRADLDTEIAAIRARPKAY